MYVYILNSFYSGIVNILVSGIQHNDSIFVCITKWSSQSRSSSTSITSFWFCFSTTPTHPSRLQGAYLPFFSFLRFYLFIFREREREGEKHQCTPHWGPGPQPRHVPWLGIKPVTFWFAGPHSVHWATPARVEHTFDGLFYGPECGLCWRMFSVLRVCPLPVEWCRV